MVSSCACPAGEDKVFTVQPNRRLSWKQSQCLVLFFAAWLIGIAAYFAFKGAWLVIPFAGLELLVIGAAVYCHQRHSYRQQVIRLNASSITVSNEKSGSEPVCIRTAWARLQHKNDPRGWYPSRLFLGSHGRYVEVGKWLREDEREYLAGAITSSLSQYRRDMGSLPHRELFVHG